MSWGFANFEDVTLFSGNDIIENAPVYLGTRPTVPLVAGEALTLTMPRSWRQTAHIAINYDSPIPAPIRAGDVLGKLTVTGQGVPQTEVKLLAGDSVPRLGIAGRAVAALTHLVTGA
jgi:D-alanyl-D-alanine carboxypeptidase (penicillin-binding protein 5/6)